MGLTAHLATVSWRRGVGDPSGVSCNPGVVSQLLSKASLVNAPTLAQINKCQYLDSTPMITPRGGGVRDKVAASSRPR